MALIKFLGIVGKLLRDLRVYSLVYIPLLIKVQLKFIKDIYYSGGRLKSNHVKRI